MSRLVERDVENLAVRLREHDEELKTMCRTGLADIAKNASGTQSGPQGIRVGVVPLTAGLGVIGGFTTAVAGIVRFLGADTYVTTATDVRGVWEAVNHQCDIVFAADDDTFIAVNLPGQRTSDNSEATGRAFAAALDLAADGIEGKDALVLGAGPVGSSATAELDRRRARIHLFDIDGEKAADLQGKHPGVLVADSLESGLMDCRFVLDATPAKAFLSHKMLRDDAVLSAPGVPLGVDKASAARLRGRLIHDVLEIGVATMLYDLL